MTRDIVFIDNLDSFTFNLVEAFERLGGRVKVLRNRVDPAHAFKVALEREALIVLSPGPGRPEDAGCCLDLIALAKYRVPLLGICLGHQAIVLEAGGRVTRAPHPVHGKASLLEHDHFHIHARIGGMAMAISDPEALQTGLQFHPESILTRGGDTMLANILANARAMPRPESLPDCA